MRRTLTNLAVLAFWVCGSQAQTSFVKYYAGLGTNKFNLNELASGNLLTGAGRGAIDTSFISSTSLLDPWGNVLNTHCYAVDTFLYMQSFKRCSDNEFAFVGEYMKDTCALSVPNLIGNPLIGRMDSLGNVIAARYYSMNAPYCGFLCRDLMVTSANDVIAWGDESFFALRVDATGEVQWAKSFGTRDGGVRFIRELPGGDLLAGIVMDTAGAVVARLDADGNFIWCKSYIRPNGFVGDCLIESDDSFIITGYTDSTTTSDPLLPDYHPKLFMMKLNGDGDVQWCKGYDNAQYLWYPLRGTRIVRAHDGNYVVLANLGFEGWNYQFRPFLMKTDHNGDTLWTRSAGRNNFEYSVFDLLACSDGGYAYSVAPLGIFKTDSLGRLPCFNRWHEVVVSDLFPTDSSFVLSSIDGAVAHPAYVTSVPCDPVDVDEPCSTSTGAPSTYRGAGKPRIRPNPNTGRFTVEFPDPLTADTYYSVYDAQGKLLYQRPLPAGATLEEVDLARFGTGTYVIKFTSPDGMLCYERVVVE